MVKLAILGDDPVIAFAANELIRYLGRMDPGAEVSLLSGEPYDPSREDVLWLGTGVEVMHLLPRVEDAELDDAIHIRVSSGCGVITGTNPRAALIAAYRFLTENGCRFISPSPMGEIIPRRASSGLNGNVCEAASYRHRGVCIEGANRYENVRDMIDWLPKAGMNAYFIQFFTPSAFFERWYDHPYNPDAAGGRLDRRTILEFRDRLEAEISKRGLMYHAVGHGWNCEPFGIPGESWNAMPFDVPGPVAGYLAQFGGIRVLFGGVPLDTNLCYGNPEVRRVMVDAAVRYCREHPGIDYLNFWLADNCNNHCECPLCRDTLPSDFYVTLLNELDARLSSEAIQTKVVFLAYMDLLWAPERERLNHPERFVMMFAPITRSYSKPYLPQKPFAESLAPYDRNRNVFPVDPAENVARLRKWQACFPGDSFDFDYHMMYDHHRDSGGIEMARTLMTDIKNLKEIGLNGLVSCQSQRAAFPSALGLTVMAAALWDRTADFDRVADRFFRDTYGPDGHMVRDYLQGLSERMCPKYLRMEMPAASPAQAQVYDTIPAFTKDFEPVIGRNLTADLPDASWNAWGLIDIHRKLVCHLATALAYCARGDDTSAMLAFRETEDYVWSVEARTQSEFDAYEFVKTIEAFFVRKSPVFFGDPV